MRRIDDQENRALGAGHQALEKLDEDCCIHPALFFDHEPHMAARGNRRDQAHAMARTRGFDDGGFAPLTPRAPGMMIGAHVSGVAKEDLGLFSLRQGFDLRVVLPEPLLDHSLVALLRTVQGLLASDAELRQQSTNRIGAQHDPKPDP